MQWETTQVVVFVRAVASTKEKGCAAQFATRRSHVDVVVSTTSSKSVLVKPSRK